MKPTLAFLGTGLMGAPMIRRLLGAGFDVRVWNRSSTKAEALRADGAVPALTAAQAVEGAQIVCLCLTDADAAEDVLFGSQGMAEALCAKALVVDFSTIGPAATLRLAQRLRSLPASPRWVDAPVSGGVNGAQSGALVVLCGGEAADVEMLRPVLASLAHRICHLGPVGSGQAAKLCNQLIVAVNVVAIAEALALGRQYGLDLKALPDALQGGWADSAPLQIIGARMAQGISDPKIVTTGTFAKDLRLVLENADATPVLARRASEAYETALAAGLGDCDVTALLAHFEEAQEANT